jgi:ubiquitin-protein ligase
MNSIINNFNQKELSGRDARLWQEWKELDTLCCKRKETSANPRQPSISYIIRKKNAMGLPTEYEIWYRVKSIIGVKNTPVPREPIFSYLHKMSIVLPNNYPSADGNPIFTFITNIWHPNIRYSGSFKGHVCLTIKEMGVLASLKDLVLRVERYLKYQLYHAENTYPYPEDQNVAEWVREEAEPNGWTRFGQNTTEPATPTPPPVNNEITPEVVQPNKKEEKPIKKKLVI